MRKDFVLHDPSAQVSIGIDGRHDSSETNNSESISDSTVNSTTIDISVLPEMEQQVSPTSSLFSQSPPSNGGPISLELQTLDSPDKVLIGVGMEAEISPQEESHVVDDKKVVEDRNEGDCSDRDIEDDVLLLQGKDAERCTEQQDDIPMSPSSSASADVMSQGELPETCDDVQDEPVASPSSATAEMMLHDDNAADDDDIQETISSSTSGRAEMILHDDYADDDVQETISSSASATAEVISQGDDSEDHSMLEQSLVSPASAASAPTEIMLLDPGESCDDDVIQELPESLASAGSLPTSPVASEMAIDETSVVDESSQVTADTDTISEMHSDDSGPLTTHQSEDSSSVSDVIEL